MAYLLDADVFIRAKNLHYGLDFCPASWEWLIHRNATGSAAIRQTSVESGAPGQIWQTLSVESVPALPTGGEVLPWEGEP